MTEQSLAKTLVDTLKIQIKRQFIIILILIICWLSTIGVFIWYINQYDYVSETTAILDTENSGSITTGDIDNG